MHTTRDTMIGYFYKNRRNIRRNSRCATTIKSFSSQARVLLLSFCIQMIMVTSFFVFPTVRHYGHNHMRFSLSVTRKHSTSTQMTPLYSASESSKYNNEKSMKKAFLDPDVIIHPESYGSIPYPKSLSPSSAMEFMKCPQSYLIQYLYGIRQPTNAALAKGSLCHSALEQLYDLKQHGRTIDNLQDLFRREWLKDKKTIYKDLFLINDDDDDDDDNYRWDVDAEKEFGEQALGLLANYYRMEDPTKVSRPNPVHRERWVRAELSVDPIQGVTSPSSSPSSNNHQTEQKAPQNNTNNNKFLMRGIIDRVDLTRDPIDKSIVLKIIDYKTGKPPNFKYNASTNARILQETFWQLKVYALLLREQYAHVEGFSVPLRSLRLMFLGGDHPKQMDFDLGSTQEERDLALYDVHVQLAGVWKDIIELVDNQDPKGFKHCNRSFCWCHRVRPRFAPGALWDDSALH